MKAETYLGSDPGKLLGHVIRSMLKDIAYRIDKKNKDMFILILGALGDGKSTLASLMCFYMDPSFKAENTIFRDYHYYKLKKKLTRGYDPILRPGLCKKKGIQFDEIKRYLQAKESMKPEAIELEKDLNDVRSLGFFMVGCIDDIKMATRWVRESRVQIIIYIPRPGECWIYKLYKGEGDDEGADMLIQEIKKRLLKGEHPYTPYRSTWKPIPEKSRYWKDYSRRKARYQINSESSRSKELLIELQDRSEATLSGYLTLRDAAKFLGINKITLWGYYRNRKYKDIKFNKKEVIKTIKGLYFSEKILIRLYTALYGVKPVSLSVLKEAEEKDA